VARLCLLNKFTQHTRRQIDRRVLRDEHIPHDKKVFTLLQPHTEWISNSKAGVPVELGLGGVLWKIKTPSFCITE